MAAARRAMDKIVRLFTWFAEYPEARDTILEGLEGGLAVRRAVRSRLPRNSQLEATVMTYWNVLMPAYAYMMDFVEQMMLYEHHEARRVDGIRADDPVVYHYHATLAMEAAMPIILEFLEFYMPVLEQVEVEVVEIGAWVPGEDLFGRPVNQMVNVAVDAVPLQINRLFGGDARMVADAVIQALRRRHNGE